MNITPSQPRFPLKYWMEAALSHNYTLYKHQTCTTVLLRTCTSQR